ncbi:hypothetical protein ACQJBY_059246 [Aegilops geniculata]
MCYTRSRYTSELCQLIRVCMLSCLHKVRMCWLLFLLVLFRMNLLLFKITSFSRISATGSKQKSTSDDRDSPLVALLQEKSWGRLGPQWIQPNPPRLHILDDAKKVRGVVSYMRKLVETSLSASTKRFEELPKGNEMLKRQSESMTLKCNCTVPLNIFPFHFYYYWSEDVRMTNCMIVDTATV